jgi:hypothetical protein
MADRFETLRARILHRHPGSELTVYTEAQAAALILEHPGIPSDLLSVFQKIGWGCIGKSRYTIHAPTPPGEIFDETTAAELPHVVIVGDNFSGDMEAYDWQRGWSFGSIGSSGKFQVSDRHASFAEFLEAEFAS